MKAINTVTGTASPEQLGTTLMHEHLLIGFAGWELDCAAPRFERKSALKTCVERLKELRDLGLETFVDPCPMDIGRDVSFMAEIASASGMRVICSTGLYKEDLGKAAYFRSRTIDDIASIYVSEINKGIDDTGIKAGLIKCATSKGQITKYEEMCLRAAARAHKATGALKRAGVGEAKIRAMLVENPRQYFQN
jgi:phosphotriesterase-related protein